MFQNQNPSLCVPELDQNKNPLFNCVSVLKELVRVRPHEDGELRGGGRRGDLREARLPPVQLGQRPVQPGCGVSDL